MNNKEIKVRLRVEYLRGFSDGGITERKDILEMLNEFFNKEEVRIFGFNESHIRKLKKQLKEDEDV